MKYLSRPITANLIVTRNCNMGCIFCGVEHMSRRRAVDASIDEARWIIDRLAEAGILHINLFGGEPLYFRYIDDLIPYIKKNMLYCSLITNGRLLTERRLDLIEEHVDAVAVSLHGLKEHHDRIVRRRGSFDHVISRLVQLEKRKIPTTVNITVTDRTVEELPQLIAYCYHETGVQTFALNRCIAPANTLLESQAFSPADLSLSPHPSITAYNLFIIYRTKSP